MERKDFDEKTGRYMAWSEIDAVDYPPDICVLNDCDRDGVYRVETQRGMVDVCDRHYSPGVF